MPSHLFLATMKVFLSALLLTLSCASVPVQDGASSANASSNAGDARSAGHSHLGFDFPDRVARFRLMGYEEFDDPRFGVVANYRLAPSDPLLVSAFVFPSIATALTPFFGPGIDLRLGPSKSEVRGRSFEDIFFFDAAETRMAK